MNHVLLGTSATTATSFQLGILTLSVVLKAHTVVFTLNPSLRKAICKSFRKRKADRHRERNELNAKFPGCSV